MSLDSRMTKPKPALKKAAAQKKAEEICSKEDGREEKGVTFPGIKLIHVGARHPQV